MTNCFVYIIRATDRNRYKIGRTNSHPTQRLRSLATGSPDPLVLIGFIPTIDPIAAEKRIHGELSIYRLHGEWFELDESLVNASLARWGVEPDIALDSVSFDVINRKYVVLKATVGKDNISVRTERCVFCGQHHNHGSGGENWRESVSVVDGISTLGHRVSHCHIQGVRFRLPNGIVVSNDSGYYLGVTPNQPLHPDVLTRAGERRR